MVTLIHKEDWDKFSGQVGGSIGGFLTLACNIEMFFILRTHSRTMILSGASLLTFLYYLLLIFSFLYIRHRIYYRLCIEYETEVKAYLGGLIKIRKRH